MPNLFKNLFLLVVLGALVYNFRSTIFPMEACAEPIPYTLGTFDSRFNITQKYFLEALAEAEAIWEDASGIDLFVYEVENKKTETLKINLIYDYRQQATSTLANLGITVKNTQASYQELKEKFTSLKVEYENLKNSFEASVDAFNKKNEAYESEVKSWNAKGGAPKEKYEELEETRLSLEKGAKKLESTQDRLKDMVDEINAMVVVLNRQVAMLNLSVDKYNAINVERGESFEEGIYSSDGIESKINIYEWSSREKLVRVLAHEFGHALKIGHVADPKAIMYELNVGASTELTEADLAELATKCELE